VWYATKKQCTKYSLKLIMEIFVLVKCDVLFYLLNSFKGGKLHSIYSWHDNRNSLLTSYI
jgi:hypothetical protein